METFLAIDFETSHSAPDSACSVGLVRVENGEIVSAVAHFIRPPLRPFLFTEIHGIRREDVQNAPDFGSLWPGIAPLFERVDFIAAHNAGFDQRVLYALCDRYGIPRPESRFECTVQLARRVFKIYPTRLSDVARTLKIELNHHEALSDAMACARIVLAALGSSLHSKPQSNA